MVHAAEDRVVVGAEAARRVERRRGPCRPACTASISAGSWTVAIRSSSAIGAGTTREAVSSTPSSSREPHGQVDPDRGHRVGGPEVVLGERRVEHHASRDPAHAGMPVTLPVLWTAVLTSSEVLSRGGPPDGGPLDRAHPLPTAAHGRPFVRLRLRRPWAPRPEPTQEPPMTPHPLPAHPDRAPHARQPTSARCADGAPARTRRGDCFFGVADLHALTTATTRPCCARPIAEMATLLLAAGLDPTGPRCSGRAGCRPTASWPTCSSARRTPAS